MQIAYSPCRRRQRFIGGSTSPDGIFSAIFAHGLLRRQRPDTSFCGKGAASYPALRHRNAQQLPREGGYLPRNDYICKRGIREERPGPLRRTAKDGGKEKAPGKGGMRSRAARAESRCKAQTGATRKQIRQRGDTPHPTMHMRPAQAPAEYIYILNMISRKQV